MARATGIMPSAAARVVIPEAPYWLATTATRAQTTAPPKAT
jgi:hypothetical protein